MMKQQDIIDEGALYQQLERQVQLGYPPQQILPTRTAHAQSLLQ